MAWETSLTNRREDGRNRTRDRKGSSEPEDPAHKREPLTERGFGALAEPRPVLRGLRRERPHGHSPRDNNSLAEPRPVLRGLRPGPSEIAIVWIGRCLQSRDPFSGDCDVFCPELIKSGRNSLQSRDPFSGDCDKETQMFPNAIPVLKACRAETRSQGIATASMRSTSASLRSNRLQSRDPFSGDCDPARGCRSSPELRQLAEPRPVLRGLRRC